MNASPTACGWFKQMSRWAAVGLMTLASHCAQAAPIVKTETGQVQGITQSGTQRFLGIPYAAPPTGDLRWQAPRPAATWSGIRLASAFGPSCPQVSTRYHTGPTSEDCLTLNVYVPEPSGSETRPVMVWLHPGGLAMGAGSDIDGALLAARANAVVVTINYRLGVLGFLSADELQREAPGANYGLQDQQQALRWVQTNIRAFGGDAGRVTVFGNSAGSFSTCLHLVSPGSNGLFHHAILQSGPCIRLGGTTLPQASELANALAIKVQCPSGAGQLACLRSMPVETLLAASPDGLDTLRAANPWQPVMDGTTLPRKVTAMIQDGHVNRVPVMLGTAADEGRFFVGYSFHQQAGRAMTDADYVSAAAVMAGSTSAGAISRALYPVRDYDSTDLAMAALTTDAGFACPALADAKRLSRLVPVFAYEFTDKQAPAPQDAFFEWGAYHTAELQYLFGKPAFVTDVSRDMTAAQTALAAQMVGYWGAFAANGNPNGGDRPVWPRFNELTTPFMNLAPGSVKPQAWGNYQKAHRCTMWSILFALTGES